MNRLAMYLDIFYLLIVAATFGMVMVLGAIVAPVVFNTVTLFSVGILDHYQEGVIMAEIFQRFSFYLYAVVMFIVMYELSWYKRGQRDMISGLAAIVSIATSLLFSAVYTPKILALQAEGPEATMGDAFASLHTASELDFKILAVALLVLFFRRVMLLRTIKH
jgi:hypothetical protein